MAHKRARAKKGTAGDRWGTKQMKPRAFVHTMDDLDLALLRACRRSRLKVRALHALEKVRVSPPGELAELTGVSVDRLLDMMHGDGRYYRRDSALVRLGVVENRRSRSGRAFGITPQGRASWSRVKPRLGRRRAAGI